MWIVTAECLEMIAGTITSLVCGRNRPNDKKTRSSQTIQTVEYYVK